MPALFVPLVAPAGPSDPSEGVSFSVTATDWGRGPWDPSSLHGGPVAALVGVAVERCDTVAPMQVTRATVGMGELGSGAVTDGWL